MLGLPWFTMVYRWPSNFSIATDTAACDVAFTIFHQCTFRWGMMRNLWAVWTSFSSGFYLMWCEEIGDLLTPLILQTMWGCLWSTGNPVLNQVNQAVIQDDEPHVLNTAHVLLVLYMTLIFRGRVPAKMEQCPTKLWTNLGRRFGSAGYPIQSNLVCVQKSRILSSNLML